MCVFFISIFLLPFCATAAEDKISFAREILPILSDKCFYCHGPDKENQKADLRSDIRDDAVAAGAIDPVHPESIPVLRTKDLTWPQNPIDHFILSQLEKENLKPSPAAPPERWLRCVASPHFGERMATPWLDVARYADSFGDQADIGTEAWPLPSIVPAATTTSSTPSRP